MFDLLTSIGKIIEIMIEAGIMAMIVTNTKYDQHEIIRLRYGFKLYWKKIAQRKIIYFLLNKFNRMFYFLHYNPNFRIGEMCN